MEASYDHKELDRSRYSRGHLDLFHNKSRGASGCMFAGFGGQPCAPKGQEPERRSRRTSGHRHRAPAPVLHQGESDVGSDSDASVTSEAHLYYDKPARARNHRQQEKHERHSQRSQLRVDVNRAF
jgi:hypothetical protein